MNARLIAGLLLVATLVTSCHWPLTGGTIDELSSVYDVQIPSTVRAGVPFEVSFMSSTGDPRWESCGEEIRSGAGDVLIVPRDRFHDTGSAAAVVADVRHSLWLTLLRPGDTRVFILTRKYVSDGPDSTARLEYPIDVLP